MAHGAGAEEGVCEGRAVPQLASGNGASRPRVARPYKRSTKSRRSLTRGRDGGKGSKCFLARHGGPGRACPKGLGASV